MRMHLAHLSIFLKVDKRFSLPYLLLKAWYKNLFQELFSRELVPSYFLWLLKSAQYTTLFIRIGSSYYTVTSINQCQ